MPWWNAIDYPVEKIRGWIAEGKTQAWIGTELGVNAQSIAKVCKKHGIQCQRTGPRAGAGHPDWKGGRVIDKTGYVLVYSPDHPNGTGSRGKYVREHRLVMEQMLGRYLTSREVVHHKNGVRSDNRPENLELFGSNAEHLQTELTGKCPKWTPEGKAAIQAAVERVGASRRGLRPDEWPKRRKIRQSKD